MVGSTYPTHCQRKKRRRYGLRSMSPSETYQTVSDFRKEVADRCKLQFGNWSTDRDETYSTRLALALFKAYKLTLMIRGAVGNYTSVSDNDEWRFGSMESRSSVIKFSPQFLIAPGRMVRMMSMGTKPADMRIDLAMGDSIGIPSIRDVVLHKLLQKLSLPNGFRGGKESSYSYRL